MSETATAERHVRLYVANLVLLATHQVDAAFWHEWQVFGVPGGIEFFLMFNLVAMALLSIGLVRVAQQRRSARGFALGCAATGGATVVLHVMFLARDHVAFWTAPSLVLLGAIALVTVGQGLSLPPRDAA